MRFIIRFLFFISVFATVGWSYAQDDWCGIIDVVTDKIQEKHFTEKRKNATLSESLFNHFFKLLDARYMLISEEDIKQFEHYKTELFKKDKACEFIEEFTTLFTSRITDFKAELNQIENSPQFFEVARTVNFNDFLEERAIDNVALKKDWHNYVAFLTLAEIYEYRQNDSLKLATEYEELLNNYKSKFVKRLSCRLEKYENRELIRKDLISNFIQAFAASFDPHTMFFSAETYNLFMESMSRDQATYGFEVLMNNEEEFIISGIQPGSAAWKSNKIHENDRITAISYNDISIDLYCTSVGRIMTQLAEDQPEFIEVQLVKTNQEVVMVKLPKEEIVNQENVVKGYILEKDNKKIGYINIPTFYSGFNYDSGQSVANDAAKEIMKLNRSGISGLILDMRFNSGGSMFEAINLTGNFIDIGPVGMVSTRDKTIEILKDMNRGMAYTGPLVVMVNGMSASATEFMAGALQDYNRAIIVGERTYGKGSVQEILPVIDFNSGNYTDPIGYLKVTTNIMYRITNDSHQGKGVKPDIVLKDSWSKDITHEDDELGYIPPDSLDKSLRYQALAPLPLDELKEKSEQRLLKNPYYQNILKELSQENRNVELVLSLTASEFEQNYEALLEENEEEQDEIEFEHDTLNVSNHNYDSDLFRVNSFLKELDDDVKNEISSDWQIIESFKIIKDYIEISNQ